MLALRPNAVLVLQKGIILHAVPKRGCFFAFNVISGDEFELNETSYWILESIVGGIEWDRLRNGFLETFQVAPLQGEADLRRIVREFHAHGIVGRRK